MKVTYIIAICLSSVIPLLFVRFGAPRPYAIKSPSVLKEGPFTIRFPLRTEKIFSAHYMDGGSIGIGFFDHGDKRYMIWLDVSGGSGRYGAVYFGEFDSSKRPDHIVANPETFDAIAYALMRAKPDCRQLKMRYPNAAEHLLEMSARLYDGIAYSF
jgi:hypothetical protein